MDGLDVRAKSRMVEKCVSVCVYMCEGQGNIVDA